MSDLNREFVQSVTVTREMLNKARVYIAHQNKHYLAESAVQTMRIGVNKYWNKHYSRAFGQTSQLALFQGGGNLQFQVAKRKYKGQAVLEPAADSRTFRSRKGRRLVSFSFEKGSNKDSFLTAALQIHSFPMNLYERDVVLGGWKNVQGIVRKGTHIMRRLLPQDAQQVVAGNTAKFQADLDRYCREV